MTQPSTLCPCGSTTSLERCCLPFIKGEAHPENPEQLMRSRFTAFTVKNAQYLCDTLHPNAHKPNTLNDLQSTLSAIHWHSLQILGSRTESEDRGFVEFVAFYSKANAAAGSRVEQLHEHSTFVTEEGRWYYLFGDILNPYTLGRNDSCWCGSGTKYKHCHASMLS